MKLNKICLIASACIVAATAAPVLAQPRVGGPGPGVPSIAGNANATPRVINAQQTQSVPTGNGVFLPADSGVETGLATSMPPGAADRGMALPATTVLGAGPAMPAGPITIVDIASSFLGADANRNGELTRAEATRLTIVPFSFEDMDRNRDGVLTRSEYDDALR